VIGDESWFYSEYVRERVWMGMDDNFPEVANRIIGSEKSMLTIVWNRDELHVITIPPTRHSFTVPWFIDQNLQSLIGNSSQMGGVQTKGNW
jgi:hypothetical protein